MKRISILTLLALPVLLFSCKSAKEVTKPLLYFNDPKGDSLATALSFDPVYQKGDVIYISVSTDDKRTTEIFNQPNIVSGGVQAGGVAPTVGYLVSNDGNIRVPVLGSYHVEGLTKHQLTQAMNDAVRQYSRDTAAVVNIRLLNYKVTVLGEVMKPGTITVTNDRLNFTEALGIAGDLTAYARRDNIKVIREVNGVRKVGIINLQDNSVFSSPYYYLRQNDVIYVEMNDRKINNVDNTNVRNIGIVATIISTLAVVTTLITQFKN